MTLDEAIKHCEEVAESKEKQVKEGVWERNSNTEKRCYECAKEHRQLAKWLKELKKLRKEQREVYENGYKEGHADGYDEGYAEAYKEVNADE